MAVPGALPPTPPRLSPVSSGSPDTAKIIRGAAIVDDPAQEILSRTPPDAKRSLFSRASAGISGLLGTCADRVAGSLDRICGRGSFPGEMKRPLLAQEAPVGQKFPPSPAKSAKPKQDSTASAAGVFPDAEGPAEGDIPLGADIPLEHMTEAAFASEMNRRHPGFLDNHPHLYNVYKRMEAMYNSPAVAFVACLGMAGWLSAEIAKGEDFNYAGVGLGAMLKHLKDCLLSGNVDRFFEKWKDLLFPMIFFFVDISFGYTIRGQFQDSPKTMGPMNIIEFVLNNLMLGMLGKDRVSFCGEALRKFMIARKDDAEVKKLEGKMQEAIARNDTKELRKVISELLRINSKKAIFCEAQAKEQFLIAKLREDPEWKEIIKAHELETGRGLFKEFFMKKRLEEAEAKGIIYATPEECFMALCKEIEDQSRAQASSKTRSFVKYTAGVVPGAALMAARLAASGSPFALMFEELGSVFLSMAAGYLGEDTFNGLVKHYEGTYPKAAAVARGLSSLKSLLFGFLMRNITKPWTKVPLGLLGGTLLQDSALKMEEDLIRELIRKIEQIGTKDVNGLIRGLYGLIENVEKEKKNRLVKALGKIVEEELKDKSPYGTEAFPWMWSVFAVANIFTGWYFHPEGFDRNEDLLCDCLYFGASGLQYLVNRVLRSLDYQNPRCGGAVAEGLKALRLVLRENPIGLAIIRFWFYSYMTREYIMTGKYETDPNMYSWLLRITNIFSGLTIGSIIEKTKMDGEKVKTSNPENQTYLPSLFLTLEEQRQIIRNGQLDQWV